MLTNSFLQDDRNERLFEVSLACEILSNLMALSFACVLTDCLLATSPSLSGLVDPAVSDAISYLLRVKSAKSAKVVAENKEEKVESLDRAKVDVKEVVPDSNEGDTGGVEISTEMKEDLVLVKETPPEYEDIVNEQSSQLADRVVKSFLAACSWFDAHNEKFLRFDHVRLIVLTANRFVNSFFWDTDVELNLHVCRHMSKGEVLALVQALVQGEKSDKLYYEKLFV